MHVVKCCACLEIYHLERTSIHLNLSQWLHSVYNWNEVMVAMMKIELWKQLSTQEKKQHKKKCILL